MKQMKQRANYFFNESFELFQTIYFYLSFRRICCEISHVQFLFLKFHLIPLVNKHTSLRWSAIDWRNQRSIWKQGLIGELLFFFFLFFLSCCAFDIMFLFWSTYCPFPINNFCFVSKISGITFLYILTDSL